MAVQPSEECEDSVPMFKSYHVLGSGGFLEALDLATRFAGKSEGALASYVILVCG